MGFLQAGSEGDRAEGCGLDGALSRRPPQAARLEVVTNGACGVFTPLGTWGEDRGASSPCPGQHLPRALLKSEWDEVLVFKNRTYGLKKKNNNLNGLKPKSYGLEKPLKKIHRGYRYYIAYYTLPVCTLWYIQ